MSEEGAVAENEEAAPLPLQRGLARALLTTALAITLGPYLSWLFLVGAQRGFLRTAPLSLLARLALGLVLWCGLLALAANLARSARAARPAVLALAGLLTPFLIWLADAWIGGLLQGGPQEAWELLPALLDDSAKIPVAVWLALASPASVALIGLAAVYAYRPPRRLWAELALAIGWVLLGYGLLRWLLTTIFGYLLREEVGRELPRSIGRSPWLWLLLFALLGLAVGLGLAAGRRLEERLALRWPWLGGSLVQDDPPPLASRRLLLVVPAALVLPLLLLFGSWSVSAASLSAREAEVLRGLEERGFAITPEALEGQPPSRNARDALEEAFGVLDQLSALEQEVLDLEAWRLRGDSITEDWFVPQVHQLRKAKGTAIYAKLDALPALAAEAAACDGLAVPLDWSDPKAARPHLERLPRLLMMLGLRALHDLAAGRAELGWRQVLVLGRVAALVDEPTLAGHLARGRSLMTLAGTIGPALYYGPPPADLHQELDALLRDLEDTAGLSRSLRGELLFTTRSPPTAFGDYLGIRPGSAYHPLVPKLGLLYDVSVLRREFLDQMDEAIPQLAVSRAGLERLWRHERTRVPVNLAQAVEVELGTLAVLRCARALLDRASGSTGPLPADPHCPDQPLRSEKIDSTLRVWSVGPNGTDDGGLHPDQWCDDILLQIVPPGRVLSAGGK